MGARSRPIALTSQRVVGAGGEPMRNANGQGVKYGMPMAKA